jgi:hypothetical protein
VERKGSGEQIDWDCGFARLSMASGFWSFWAHGIGYRDWAFGRCTICITIVGAIVFDIDSVSFRDGVYVGYTTCALRIYHSTTGRCTSSSQITSRYPHLLLFPTLPNPFLILFPLSLDVPEPPPTLALSTNSAIQS